MSEFDVVILQKTDFKRNVCAHRQTNGWCISVTVQPQKPTPRQCVQLGCPVWRQDASRSLKNRTCPVFLTLRGWTLEQFGVPCMHPFRQRPHELNENLLYTIPGHWTLNLKQECVNFITRMDVLSFSQLIHRSSFINPKGNILDLMFEREGLRHFTARHLAFLTPDISDLSLFRHLTTFQFKTSASSFRASGPKIWKELSETIKLNDAKFGKLSTAFYLRGKHREHNEVGHRSHYSKMRWRGKHFLLDGVLGNRSRTVLQRMAQFSHESSNATVWMVSLLGVPEGWI